MARQTFEASNESIKDKYFTNFDRLDQERIRYMRAAANFAGLSLLNGVYKWSSSLEKVGKTLTYWKLLLNLLRSRTYTSDRLEWLQLSISMDDSGLYDFEYVTLQHTTS